jgi:porphobilinogen deaminase
MTMPVIRIASGDHPIDLNQAAHLERTLRSLPEAPDVIAVTVESSRDPSLHIERLAWALHQGHADAAVCPAGYMSSGLPEGIQVAAVCPYGDPIYQCVALEHPSMADLPPDSKIVTWDAVARAQILHKFPGRTVETARTWAGLFEGLRHRVWAAACLPPEVVEAGGHWGLHAEPVDASMILPAIGLADLALFTRDDSKVSLVSDINDPITEARLRIESAFWWQAMEICGTVATAVAEVGEDKVDLVGVIAEAEGAWLVRNTTLVSPDNGEYAAQDLAETCKKAAKEREAAGSRRERAAS